MKITVHVKPNARAEKVETMSDGSLKVSVTSPPDKGRANAAVIGALAEHFNVAQSQLVLKSGKTKRHKIIEITTQR